MTDTYIYFWRLHVMIIELVVEFNTGISACLIHHYKALSPWTPTLLRSCDMCLIITAINLKIESNLIRDRGWSVTCMKWIKVSLIMWYLVGYLFDLVGWLATKSNKLKFGWNWFLFMEEEVDHWYEELCLLRMRFCTFYLYSSRAFR